MIHKATVEKYPGDLKTLAVELGDLRYDALAHFLQALSDKLREDGQKDADRKRKKLATHLQNTADLLNDSAEEIQSAWEICEPYMP